MAFNGQFQNMMVKPHTLEQGRVAPAGRDALPAVAARGPHHHHRLLVLHLQLLCTPSTPLNPFQGLSFRVWDLGFRVQPPARLIVITVYWIFACNYYVLALTYPPGTPRTPHRHHRLLILHFQLPCDICTRPSQSQLSPALWKQVFVGLATVQQISDRQAYGVQPGQHWDEVAQPLRTLKP